MRVLGLSFVSLLLSAAAAQDDFDFSSCTTEDADAEQCARKIDTVVEAKTGGQYFTKIACKDCPYAETFNLDADDGQPESRMTHGDQELFFNVTLANDTRSVLLNGKKIFPVLQTIPNPPHIAVPLLHPDFSYKNLTAATTCSDPSCSSPEITSDCTSWCQSLPLARMAADYSYSSHMQREEADAHIRIWDVIFDPVGGRSVPATPHTSGVSAPWQLDDTDRKALYIVIAGQPVKRGNRHRPHNEDDGGLFGPVQADEIYSLTITSVSQVVRRFDFPSSNLGFFGRIKRFFGGDVWKSEGELVYLGEEWGVWGKKGTLRNWVGDVFHSNFLGLFFIVIGSVVGGFITLRIVQSAWLFFKQQRSLASWKGIDAVYSQLNQGNGHEERWDERSDTVAGSSRGSFGGNWQGDYRDSYEEGPSRPSMTWDEQRMKPLPTKPLPEKPLPQEPLIDT
ncbi:hypothetical protein E8E11_002412 [Didymella keratinophila]|nr:hypothetical protein E8E11_002412 [Didymella keratinophila]